MFPGLTKGNAKVNYGNSTYALKMVSKKMGPIALNGSFRHIVDSSDVNKLLQKASRRGGSLSLLSLVFSAAPPLRVASSPPGRFEAYLGGNAVLRWTKRGAGFNSLGSRCRIRVEAASVACGSRSPDFSGRIWHALAFFFLAVQLRWRELWQGRSRALGISYNKALFSFLWRFPELVLHHGARRSPVMSSVRPSRWWLGGDGGSDKTFFNKWYVSKAQS
jgi:hypothetical protein